MKTYPECFECFLRQALIASRMAGADIEQQKKVQQEIAGLLFTVSADRDPPYIATSIFHAVNKIMNNNDPYSKVKEEYNVIAAKKIPELISIAEKALDSLYMAIRIALAGNIIDFGLLESFDLDAVITDTINRTLAIDHYTQFKELLGRSKNILYITDNAGEIGFDVILMDEIRRRYNDSTITVAVKKYPVINDATVYDAQYFGIEKKYRIIDNGSHHVGTYLPSCSDEMIAAYQKADMIIAKGQANFESLEAEADKRHFFLLKAKCGCVARVLGVQVGDVVLKRGRDVNDRHKGTE
jgi:uncharacterized protein with ATP-grasp and redox domains